MLEIVVLSLMFLAQTLCWNFCSENSNATCPLVFDFWCHFLMSSIVSSHEPSWALKEIISQTEYLVSLSSKNVYLSVEVRYGGLVKPVLKC